MHFIPAGQSSAHVSQGIGELPADVSSKNVVDVSILISPVAPVELEPDVVGRDVVDDAPDEILGAVSDDPLDSAPDVPVEVVPLHALDNNATDVTMRSRSSSVGCVIMKTLPGNLKKRSGPLPIEKTAKNRVPNQRSLRRSW
jgi:hypothetical protein